MCVLAVVIQVLVSLKEANLVLYCLIYFQCCCCCVDYIKCLLQYLIRLKRLTMLYNFRRVSIGFLYGAIKNDFKLNVDKCNHTFKALYMLGWMKRFVYIFTGIQCLQSIYVDHVRSHIEFAYIVWSPNYHNIFSLIF